MTLRLPFNVIKLTVLAFLCHCLVLGATLSLAMDGKVDLNAATMEQLQQVKGIGPAIAQRILDYKQQHGSFKTVEDLLNVKGIGKSKLAALREVVTVGLAAQSSESGSENSR